MHEQLFGSLCDMYIDVYAKYKYVVNAHTLTHTHIEEHKTTTTKSKRNTQKTMVRGVLSVMRDRLTRLCQS